MVLYFLGGVAVGVILTIIFSRKDETQGVIEIDHVTEQLKVHMSSDKIQDPRIKKVVFEVDHNGRISRDKQAL